MNIYVNRIPKFEPYGGGNQFLASFVNYMKKRGHHISYDFKNKIDVMFVLDPRPSEPQYHSINDILRYKFHNPNTKIVHRVNECDARKNTNEIDNLLIETMKRSDKVIFISEWLKNYFMDHKNGYKSNSTVIYNGCDTTQFKPFVDKKPNTKIKLVTHHWSDNWMKGFDIYTEIDKFLQANDKFEFTYIGRYYKDYLPKKTNLISPMWGIDLGNELRTHDIYVTASRNEPCGMHHIEAAACGLPVLYHTSGGGINELAGKHGYSFSNFDEFIIMFDKTVQNIDQIRNHINYDYLSIERCCEQFALEIENC